MEQVLANNSLLRAASNVGRLVILVSVFTVLLVMRAQAGIAVNLLLTATAAIGLYLVFGGSSSLRLLIIYIIGFGLFDQLRVFAAHTDIATHFNYVIAFDKDVFGNLPSVWLQDRFYVPGRIGALDVSTSAVYVSYFLVVHIVALVVWLQRPQRFPLYAGAVLLTFYVGLLACALVPTAPPWLAGQTGHTAPIHRIFRELVNAKVPQSYNDGSTIAGINDVAAMPSLHMAITVVVALAAWSFNRTLGVVGAIYAFLMGFSLIYLGEHYFADVLAGTFTALICWLIALVVWTHGFHRRVGKLQVGLDGVAEMSNEPF